jgi:hypothetical protein
MTTPGNLRVENNLGDTFSIPQIDENQAAVVPSPVDPTGQSNFRANIFYI